MRAPDFYKDVQLYSMAHDRVIDLGSEDFETEEGLRAILADYWQRAFLTNLKRVTGLGFEFEDRRTIHNEFPKVYEGVRQDAIAYIDRMIEEHK